MTDIFRTILVVSLLLAGCTSSTDTSSKDVKTSKIIGGGCDGCELMFVGMPEKLDEIDTSAGWYEKGQKILITGTVYKLDGKTPAPDVIIYYWQTDNLGYYSSRPGLDERVERHGHIRGWVKTDSSGKYSIFTIRPAPYPDNDIPAHIHVSIKESQIDNEYYIDDFVFDDDKLLVGNARAKLENRGGSGVLRVLLSGDLQIAERNIILGLHIPGYPGIQGEITSGRNIGEDNPSFTPYHAWGPDKGTTACPVCKYGRYHGILYFVGSKADWSDIKKWLIFLEAETKRRGKYLKVYLVYGNEINYEKQIREKELEKIGNELNLKNIALTYVPSFEDRETEVYKNHISPQVSNTFIIYWHSKIVEKFIDLSPVDSNFTLISEALNRTMSRYHYLQTLHSN